jgi:RNA polymerase sigma-70 factor, ECF subfamily
MRYSLGQLHYCMSKELFQRIIDGDVTAFEVVYKTHFKSMCFYSGLFGINLEQAKEIVQFTFVKFWEVRYTLKAQGPVENYLYHLLKNNCIDYLRYRKVHQAYMEPASENISEKFLIEEDNSHMALIYEQLEQKFLQTIHNFPPQMKEVFVLSRIEQLKYREIAEKLNISVKTVEIHISRALTRLREELKDYLPFLLFLLLPRN